MTRARYGISPRATPIEAARTAVGEELPGYLPILQEPPSEIRHLIAELVALDDAKRRSAERRVATSLPLQLPLWPQA